MAKDYYVSLCQRKIRKIEKRIELGKKHLDPSKEMKSMKTKKKYKNNLPRNYGRK